MAVLGIKVNAWQNADAFDRRILRMVSDVLALGTPARFNDGTEDWFVFSDVRFSLQHVAYLGALIRRLVTLTSGQKATYDALDDETLRSTVINWLRTSGYVVDPDSIDYTDVTNPWQHTLDAQGTPAAMRMADSVPGSWTAVNPDA